MQGLLQEQPGLLREAGRWMKRQHIAWKRERTRGREKVDRNTELNWREFWHKRTQLESFPRFVQVGTNWTCNLKCNFCRLTMDSTQELLKQLPRDQMEISAAVLDTVLELMPYPEMITLTPLGEPLLYTKIGRVLERHRELNNLNLAMTTNANLINEQRARMIVEGGVAHLFVSIDSDDPEIYAGMRVRGKLDRVEAALDAINHWKDKLHSYHPTMTLASTFMERNVRQMPSLVDFAKRHRFKDYNVQLMEMDNPELEEEYLGNHIQLAKEMVLETLKRGEITGVEVKIHLALRNLLTSSLSLPEQRKVHEHGEGVQDNFWNGADPSHEMAQAEVGVQAEAIDALSTRGSHLLEKCHYPWYYLLIDTDGDCRSCCWASTSLGNLNRHEFQKIWNGDTALRVRTDFLRNHIPTGCQGKHCRVDLDHFGTLENPVN